jgi:hypothetical protein
MQFFKPQSTKNIAIAMLRSIKSYENAEDKDDFCNPDAPLLILINGKRHHVLSVGGSPDEDGLILEVKPASWWKK